MLDALPDTIPVPATPPETIIPEILDENDEALVLGYGLEYENDENSGILLPLAHACIEEQDYLAVAEKLGISDLVKRKIIEEHDFYDIGLYRLKRAENGKIIEVGDFMHRVSILIAEKTKRPVYVVASKHSRIKGDPNRQHARTNEAVYNAEAKVALAEKIDLAEAQATHWLFWGMVDRWQEIAGSTTRIDVHTMTRMMNGKRRPDACVISSDREYGERLVQLFKNTAHMVKKLYGRMPETKFSDPYDITKGKLLARNMPGMDYAVNVEICNDQTRKKPIQKWYANVLAEGIEEGLFDRRSRISLWLQFKMVAHKMLWAATVPKAFSVWPLKDFLARALPQRQGTSAVHDLAAIKVFVDLMAAEGRYLEQYPGNSHKASYLEKIHLKAPRQVGFLFEREQKTWLQQHGLDRRFRKTHATGNKSIAELIETLNTTVMMETPIHAVNLADIEIRQPMIARLADNRVIMLLGEAEMNKTCYVATYDPSKESWAYYRKDELRLRKHATEPSLYPLRTGQLPSERLYAMPAATVASIKKNLTPRRKLQNRYSHAANLALRDARHASTAQPLVITDNHNHPLYFKGRSRQWKRSRFTMASLTIARPIYLYAVQPTYKGTRNVIQHIASSVQKFNRSFG